MDRVNLIPRHRKHARQGRLRLRGWMAACAAYALVLVVACSVCSARWSVSGRATSDKLRRTGEGIEQSHRAIETCQGELATAREALQASLDMQAQPDWSLLLAVLAQQLDDQLVLSDCQLAPTAKAVQQPAAPAGAQRPDGYDLVLGGYGKTQSAVSRFVLRMDRMDLFNQVRLLRTNRGTFGNGTAVAFHLKCRLHKKRQGQQ